MDNALYKYLISSSSSSSYYYYYYYYNHNYIKILESDWSSAGVISAEIVQLHTSLVIVQLYALCLSN